MFEWINKHDVQSNFVLKSLKIKSENEPKILKLLFKKNHDTQLKIIFILYKVGHGSSPGGCIMHPHRYGVLNKTNEKSILATCFDLFYFVLYRVHMRRMHSVCFLEKNPTLVQVMDITGCTVL